LRVLFLFAQQDIVSRCQSSFQLALDHAQASWRFLLN
jgi:hypothetical protein